MDKRASSKRYPPEWKERAVCMVGELRHADPGDQGVISRVARQLGVGTSLSGPGSSRPTSIRDTNTE